MNIFYTREIQSTRQTTIKIGPAVSNRDKHVIKRAVRLHYVGLKQFYDPKMSNNIVL